MNRAGSVVPGHRDHGGRRPRASAGRALVGRRRQRDRRRATRALEDVKKMLTNSAVALLDALGVEAASGLLVGDGEVVAGPELSGVFGSEDSLGIGEQRFVDRESQVADRARTPPPADDVPAMLSSGPLIARFTEGSSDVRRATTGVRRLGGESREILAPCANGPARRTGLLAAIERES
jgi:hypothetical protein